MAEPGLHSGRMKYPRKPRQIHYSSDTAKGIGRVSRGSKFEFRIDGKKIVSKSILSRITTLAVPPAWKDVWICPDPFGHIQATGRDIRGRKQYRYHSEWSAHRNQGKFSRMVEFGKRLSLLRHRIALDLSRRDLGERRVLAAVIRLMEETYIRVGGTEYKRLNGSYGITTLNDRHVSVGREKLRFSFRGKSGVYHSISLRSRRLARIVKQCRDIPGQELFQYYDKKGVAHVIDSGRLNKYLREAMGSAFTAKDLRTWSGTLQAFCVMKLHAQNANRQIS